MDAVRWVQNWYAAQCNGDWEHQYGIAVETLDNPGWSVKIDLTDTHLADRPFASVVIESSDHDWLRCRVEDKTFFGVGGPESLIAICAVFKDWADVPTS